MSQFQFAVITPTTGRQSLAEAIMSVRWQTLQQTTKKILHMVIGDGPLGPEVAELCKRNEVFYYELPKKQGNYGSPCRNFALESIERNKLADYILYLDDDNIMFPGGIERFAAAIKERPDAKVLYQRCIYRNDKVSCGWIELPLKHYYTDVATGLYYGQELGDRKMERHDVTEEPFQASWDGHCGCFRADAIAGLRWSNDSVSDYQFAEAVRERIGEPFTPIEGLVAVHM